MPYETKPMKKQWIDVEGIMTPIILPQIWNHELQDWVVTSEQNPLPTQVTGSNAVKIDTLVNAETVDGEGNLRTEITATNESYIMLLTTVDNTDWSMRVRDVAGSLFYGRTYPDTENVEAATTINNPFYAMILGYRNLQDGSNRVSSWTEAKELALPPNYLNSVASANLQFDNHNSEEATVTIRLLRVWE